MSKSTSRSKKVSTVWFKPHDPKAPAGALAREIGRLFDAAGFARLVEPDDLFAIKLHFGEVKTRSQIPPAAVRLVADKIKAAKGKPFLIETSTLYTGRRHNAVDHLMLAHEHGFTLEATGAPIIMADGLLGESQVEVRIDGKHFKQVKVATGARAARGLLVLSHATGHPEAGFGAAIKNVSMGLSSRGGKLSQHSGVKPSVKQQDCVGCKICAEWCPAHAIEVDKKAEIDEAKCVGCGQCFAVCPHGAIQHDWGAGTRGLQEKMAEVVLGVVKGREKKVGYINVLKHITKGCDCFGSLEEPGMPDVGVLASHDPIAIDTATYDLMLQHGGADLFKKWWPHTEPTVQLEYGESLGLGSRQYEVVKVE